MKSVKNSRGMHEFDADDRGRSTKLPPMKKSGKERYNMYSSLDDEDDLDDMPVKRESVFDYFDDEDDE